MNETIKALLAEREGYVRRGLKDRAKLVDEALAAAGYVETKSAPKIETAVVESRDETSSVSKAAARRRA